MRPHDPSYLAYLILNSLILLFQFENLIRTSLSTMKNICWFFRGSQNKLKFKYKMEGDYSKFKLEVKPAKKRLWSANTTNRNYSYLPDGLYKKIAEDPSLVYSKPQKNKNSSLIK